MTSPDPSGRDSGLSPGAARSPNRCRWSPLMRAASPNASFPNRDSPVAFPFPSCRALPSLPTTQSGRRWEQSALTTAPLDLRESDRPSSRPGSGRPLSRPSLPASPKTSRPMPAWAASTRSATRCDWSAPEHRHPASPMWSPADECSVRTPHCCNCSCCSPASPIDRSSGARHAMQNHRSR